MSESKTLKVNTDSKWVRTNLVVLGLSWKTTDEELRDYFSEFGELQLAQVKIDPISKKSKGYGFIRFADDEVQVQVMLQKHQINDRWCHVRIPISKNRAGEKCFYKVHVGHCTEDLTENVLRQYFLQFGEINDLYVPKPFRAFAFVTFVDPSVAIKVCNKKHRIKNTKVYVTRAFPKKQVAKEKKAKATKGPEINMTKCTVKLEIATKETRNLSRRQNSTKIIISSCSETLKCTVR